jgi:hypothetical protein
LLFARKAFQPVLRKLFNSTAELPLQTLQFRSGWRRDLELQSFPTDFVDYRQAIPCAGA